MGKFFASVSSRESHQMSVSYFCITCTKSISKATPFINSSIFLLKNLGSSRLQKNSPDNDGPSQQYAKIMSTPGPQKIKPKLTKNGPKR